jgi:hypothetical protein
MRAVRWLAMGVLALAWTGATWAHGTGSHTGLVSTVVGTEPLVPGLLVQVLGGHEQLSVHNFTGKHMVMFDGAGAPVARLEPGESYEWPDPRITWSGPVPDEQKLLRNWRIPGEVDGRRFAIVGFLGYVPPPGKADADTNRWLIAGAVAAGVLALAGLGVGARLARRTPTPE